METGRGDISPCGKKDSSQTWGREHRGGGGLNHSHVSCRSVGEMKQFVFLAGLEKWKGVEVSGGSVLGANLEGGRPGVI